jgi:hypothetical protein
MTTASPYRRRPVRFLELWDADGWRVKVYGIAYDGELPRPELIAAGKRVARHRLPQPPDADERAGVAVLIVHDAFESTWVLVEWWAGNVLYHHAYSGHPDTPQTLAAVADGATACTWELAVIGFERMSWLENVIAAAEPDVDRYLAAQFNDDV